MGHFSRVAVRYPAPMFNANLNPLESWPVTVVTQHLVIQGILKTRLHRITDVLNEPDMDHLILYEVAFMEVGSRRVVTEASIGQIQLEDMLFVHTNGPTESGSEQRTPKKPTRATLLMPPFTIEGEIHLPMEEELNQALDGLTTRFVPVTSARYWAYGVAESPNYVDLLVVNRMKAHVALPIGIEWKKQSIPAQNPW